MVASTRELKCYFYQLNGTQQIKQHINHYFSKITNQDIIATESISGFDYYITRDIIQQSAISVQPGKLALV